MPKKCLFCRDTDRVKTNEHVIQKTFGGSITLSDEVCTKCNSEIFDAPDGELERYVKKFACHFHPLFEDKPTFVHETQGVWFDEVAGVYISARISKELKPIMLPQIIIVDVEPQKMEVKFVIDKSDQERLEELVESFFAELADPEKIKSIKPLIFNVREKRKLEPAIIRAGKNKFAVRASSEEEAERLIKLIKDGKFSGNLFRKGETQERTKAGIPYQSSFNVNVGYIQRALAKSALEVLCVLKGYDFCMDNTFDPIRDFARFEWSESNDNEFVSDVVNTDVDAVRDLRFFFKQDCHTVIYTRLDGFHTVLFIFYQRPIAAVKLNLTPTTSSKNMETKVILLNYKDKTHRIFDLENDSLAFLEEFHENFPVIQEEIDLLDRYLKS